MKHFQTHQQKCNTLKARVHHQLFEHDTYKWDWGNLTPYENGRLLALESAWELIDSKLRLNGGMRSLTRPRSLHKLKKILMETCMNKMNAWESKEYKLGFTEALDAI